MTKESEKTKRIQRTWLVGVIVVCLVSLVVGAFLYIRFLNHSLEEQLAQNVMSVTIQQQQAFDRFIVNDQERVHSCVEHFSKNPISDSDMARDMLSLFAVVDAEYSVICLDEGWARSSRYEEVHLMDEAQLEEYNALTGSGVRNDFTAIFSGTPKFGYYETFTFAGTGHRGVIQKGYDRNRIQETFSLSFYDDRGYTFVIDRNGDILMRPAVSPEGWGDNIFDAITSAGGDPETIDEFKQMLQSGETGSVTLRSVEWDETAFTYIPMESVDGWFLVSVVPVDAIQSIVDGILQKSRVALLYMGNFSRIRFEIEDNGVGMSQDYQSSLFNPFSREDSQINLDTQGSGLGLAIVKSLLDLMGGGIRVKSAPGKGSTFTVELDIRILVKDAEPRFWMEHQVRKMLIVDNDEAACRIIVNAMSKSGVSTDYATNSETALRMLIRQRETEEPYNLILLDWMMPDLDGVETARRIRKDCQDQTPICLLTTYNWSDIRQEATEAGVNDFMPKPFFMSTFKNVVRRIMSRQRKVENFDVSGGIIRGKHAMIVDDIEINCIVLSKIMGNLGAWCDTAANGQEALEKFAASQPGEYDLILMDLQMPVLDGYDAARAIRVCDHPSAKSIPIIAVTANAFADDVRAALEAGMNAHIAKPIQTDQLKSIIQELLGEQMEQTEKSM